LRLEYLLACLNEGYHVFRHFNFNFIMAEETPQFKLVIVGTENTGKTSLLAAYRGKGFEAKVKSSDQAKQVNVSVEL
jgi:GTPase SAR1 family protein